MLRLFQEVSADSVVIKQCVVKIVHHLYEMDVLEEAAIFQWHSDTPDSDDIQVSMEVRKQVRWCHNQIACALSDFKKYREMFDLTTQSTQILFTVIQHRTYGKGPLRFLVCQLRGKSVRS